ncbi:MAG: hypothetical protein RL196_874 [Actinomycetota bacterium]|jgi:uncharacterized LabA/DUF88 family protein
MKPPKRVGIYVDAFNLYYGARDWCGKGEPGWRWLNVIGLVDSLIEQQRNWAGAEVERLVYCTALRPKSSDVTSLKDQQTYIQALSSDQRVHVEYGQYVEKRNTGALSSSTGGRRTKLVDAREVDIPEWLSHSKKIQPDGKEAILVSVQTFEEKGSDVNVASHLLLDLAEGRIDGAVVISNDGDLKFALASARERIPLGLVNPTKRDTVSLLLGENSGVTGCWWIRLGASHFFNHQLHDQIGFITKPFDW